MTTQISELELVDTSDLELLDDERHHGFCYTCHGLVRSGDIIIALCGVRTMMRYVGPDPVPPNACKECSEIDEPHFKKFGHWPNDTP